MEQARARNASKAVDNLNADPLLMEQAQSMGQTGFVVDPKMLSTKAGITWKTIKNAAENSDSGEYQRGFKILKEMLEDSRVSPEKSTKYLEDIAQKKGDPRFIKTMDYVLEKERKTLRNHLRPADQVKPEAPKEIIPARYVPKGLPMDSIITTDRDPEDQKPWKSYDKLLELLSK